MNQPTCAFALCAAVLCLPAQPARAQAADPAPPGAFSLVPSVVVATDYVWRGQSQTNGKPVVFGEIDLGFHGFYLDGRTENVDFSGAKQEYDNRAGYVLPLGRLKLDLGFIRYGYVKASSNFDTLEGAATLSGDWGKLNAHLAANYTRNYFGTHAAGEYYEAGTTWQVRPKFALNASFGRQIVDRTMHYDTWNLGVDYTLRKGIDLTVAYIDTDTAAFGNQGGARAMGSISFAF